jgi:hypothetical protein
MGKTRAGRPEAAAAMDKQAYFALSKLIFVTLDASARRLG